MRLLKQLPIERQEYFVSGPGFSRAATVILLFVILSEAKDLLAVARSTLAAWNRGSCCRREHIPRLRGLVMTSRNMFAERKRAGPSLRSG